MGAVKRDVGEDIANLHATVLRVRSNRACILSRSFNRTMHDDVLERTRELGNERSIATVDVHHDSEGMAIAIEIAVNPVAGVEDVLIGLSINLDVVRHLHVDLEAVANTVPAFSYINIVCALQEPSVVCCVVLQSIEVEAAADGAHAPLVECVLCCLVATAVGESELSLSLALTVTISSCGSINTSCSKCSGNGERVCADCLYPVDLTLVVVQLIADATVGEILVCNNCRSVVVAPLIGDIVVVVGTRGTVCIRIFVVSLQINHAHVAAVTSDVRASAVREVEAAAITDDEAVCYGDRSVGPTDETTAVLGSSTCDGELCQTVLDDCTTIGNADKTAVSGVTCHSADYIDVNVAATNDTAAPCSNTGSKLLVGCNGTLHFQVLDDTMHTHITEECGTILALREQVDRNGVTCTIKDALEVLAVATNHGNICGGLLYVCRQHGMGIGIVTIYEFCKRHEVICSTDLIDAAHFGKRPCSCADHAH